MTEKDIMTAKKKIGQKNNTPMEYLELLRELNSSISKLNQELKNFRDSNNLKNN